MASDQLGRSQIDRIAIGGGTVLFGQRAQSEASPGTRLYQTWVGLNRIGYSLRPALLTVDRGSCGEVWSCSRHGDVVGMERDNTSGEIMQTVRQIHGSNDAICLHKTSATGFHVA